MATFGGCSAIKLMPPWLIQGVSINTILTGMIMDADTEMLAVKYYPQSISPITDIDWYWNITGNVTGINFQIEVQTDSADAPSGTVLGAATAEFAGPAADGFIGLKTLATGTGNLTINVPVWIVIRRSSGASLSGTDYFALVGTYGSNLLSNLERERHHNGTNWTTTTVRNDPCLIVIKHVDGSYVGLSVTSGTATPTNAVDIFGTNRQGFRFKAGAQCKIMGVSLLLTKAGSPSNLVLSIYEGSTLKYSETIPAASILTAVGFNAYFASPVLLSADTNIYITLKQEADGGTDANDYDFRVHDIISTYISAVYSSDMRFVYGTGDDPTAYTVEETEVLANLSPLIFDMATDLDQAAGGGRPEIRGSNL